MNLAKKIFQERYRELEIRWSFHTFECLSGIYTNDTADDYRKFSKTQINDLRQNFMYDKEKLGVCNPLGSP